MRRPVRGPWSPPSGRVQGRTALAVAVLGLLTTSALAAVAMAPAHGALGQEERRWVMLGTEGLELPVYAVGELLGPSGAGVTTLLRSLPARLFRDTGGSADQGTAGDDGATATSGVAGAASAAATPSAGDGAIPGGGSAGGDDGSDVARVLPLHGIGDLELWAALSEHDVTARYRCRGPRVLGTRIRAGFLLQIRCTHGTGPVPFGGWIPDGLAAAPPVNVVFPIAGSRLPDEARDDLETLIARLRSHPSLEAVVSGDAAEGEPEPGPLARRRAERVRRFLIDGGAPDHRVHAISYGDLQPRSLAEEEAGWRKRRRAAQVLLLAPTLTPRD